MDAFIDGGVKSGAMIVRGGEEPLWKWGYLKFRERHKLVTVTRVIFLLNITKVSDNSCIHAVNLVVVGIPEGVKSID